MGTSMLPTMICQELELERFRVVAFSGIEELSEPYVFTIDLQSDHDTPPDALDLGKMVGKTAALVLARPDDIEGGQRKINGVIAEASHLGMNSQHMQTWRIELRSPLWLLSLGRHFSTFEDKTTADIVQKLLSKYNLTGTLDGCTHRAKRVLQHSESDLDLVQRLLAEEGRAWMTANQAVDDFTFVTAGSHEVLCPNERLIQGAFDPALSDDDRDDDADHFGVVLDFRAIRRVTFASAKINAQTPKRYSQVSTSEATVKKAGIFTVTGSERQFPEHHGGVRNAETSFAARKVATWISERATALATQASGTSDLHQIGAGFCLKISGNQDPNNNAKWVLTQVEHTYRAPHPGEDPVYRNAFTCVPFAGPLLRPALREPPRVAGIRLGVISNSNLPADGDDEPGSTENTSFYEVTFASETTVDGDSIVQRMRVAHPWAGPDRGFHFPLEVGDEVVVSHEHGDPGRPFILGCLHNAINKGPRVTTENGKSTSGVLRSRTGHELRFGEDEGAGTITLITSTKDHTLVFDDGKKQTALTTKGKYVVSATDDASITTKAKLTMKSTADASLATDAKGSFTAASSLTISSSGSEVSISSPTKISLTVGGSSIVIEPAKITIHSVEIGINGDAKATVAAPVAQFGKAGGATTVIGSTVGVQGTASVTCSAIEVTVDASGAAKVKGTTVDVKGSGAVAIGGASVGING